MLAQYCGNKVSDSVLRVGINYVALPLCLF